MYILECADGSYYTGSTTNLELRLAQHQAGEGANHTKKRLPVKLVYYEFFQRIQDAFYREKQVQGWSRKKKEALIKGDYELLKELSRSYTKPLPELVEGSGNISVASTSSATGETINSATGEKKPLPEPFPEPPPLPEPFPKPLPELAEGSGNIPVASTSSATGETINSATGEKKPLPEPFPEPVEGNGSGKNKKTKAHE
jgi:putative endonuclease